MCLQQRQIPRPVSLLVIVLSCLLTSCASLITTTVIEPAVGNLQQQTDIELVCEGSPAYLLMIDSMLVSSPSNPDLLVTAAKSYSAFSAALTECGKDERIPAIADKARDYGMRLVRQHLPDETLQNDEALSSGLANLTKDDVAEVFWGVYGWLTWVQSENGSPTSLADTVIIERIMQRLLELDETFENGAIHLFFGLYHAAKPAMFGGRPDLAETHFKRALSISGRRFLVVQTMYAEILARSAMDAVLHDSLLEEVLAFDLQTAPELALSNRIAQSRAARLMAENYFGD